MASGCRVKPQRPSMSPLPLLPLLLVLAVAAAAATAPAECGPTPPRPVPTPWPEQYHAVVVGNQTESGGRLRQLDIYYDWPRGRALNVIRDQLSDDQIVDIQWTNGTSFIFDGRSCQTFHYAVGLLPPDWTSRAAYLGRERVDGFDCHVWSNFDFDRYDEDVATGRPVSWIAEGFERRHVLSFEAGAAVLPDDSKFQAPAYCFSGSNAETNAEMPR